MKQGLVLEGGGMRCMFTTGVTDAMMEHGITFDGIIGVSAGALFGCNYKSHQPGRALRYNIRFKDDPRYMGIRTFLRTGEIVGSDFAFHTVPFELDVFDAATFEADPTEFWMVCTDIETGKPYYHKMDTFSYENLDYMRASASMPIVSRPVMLNGRVLLDGGMTDSIPLEGFQKMGYERNIVVLSQPRGYRKQPTKLTPLFRLLCKKFPRVAEIMSVRHGMYNRQLDYLLNEEKKGNTLLIFPPEKLNIGRTELNEKKMRHIHALGRSTAENMMDQIKLFLSEK